MASKKPVEQPVEDKSERLSLLKSRLAVAKAWCKKPHDTMKKWIKEYELDDLLNDGEEKDRVRIGYIFRRAESDLPAIFDDQPELIMKGRHPATKDITPIIEGLYDYLWDTQNLEEKIEDAGLYFVLIGMGFIESPWVTKTKQVPQPVVDQITGQPVLDESGQPVIQLMDVPIIDQPMAKVVNPFKLYFSPETKFNSVMDAEHCPYYITEETMTKEQIKARFGKDVEANETLKLDEDVDADIEKESAVIKDDFKRVTVYKYEGILTEETAKDIEDAGAWSYDKEYELWFTSNEELQARECPYDNKPLFCVGNYGTFDKFWKFGDAKHLLPIVRELEQYRTQILKHTRKMANPRPLQPTLANIDEKAWLSNQPSQPIKYDGQIPPSYLSPANLSSEVQIGVEMARTDLEKTSGSFDLNSGGGQSQVKTPRGIQVFSEAADRNVRRKKKKIARMIRQLIMFQFSQVSKIWSPEDNRTIMAVAGNKPEAVQVTQEVLEAISGVNQYFTLDIEVESMSANRVQMKQDELTLFDLMAQHPEVFNLMEAGKDLLQNGFGKKDGDRFLVPMEQQMQQFIAANPQMAQQMLNEVVAQQQQMAMEQQLSQNPVDGNTQPQPGPTPQGIPGQ